jgi:AcrR family transcriptional regulator
VPTPARTSIEEIVGAARDILDADGQTGLTMQAVAARVGVRSPSLYKHVRSRDDLVGLVATSVAQELAARLGAIGGDAGDPRGQLIELAHLLRRFAHAQPEQYRLLFAPASEASRATPEALASSVAPLIDITTRLAGRGQALEAARTATAWATGFIAMEFAGAFRLGGDVDDAYDYGISRIADALAAGSAPADPSQDP